MKTGSHIAVVMMIFLFSCTAPINLTYDSARTIDKGSVEFTGNYSAYRMPAIDFFYIAADDKLPGNSNYGFVLGYGILDRYTLKLRYERLKPVNYNENLNIMMISI